jgi:hypothetical protein
MMVNLIRIITMYFYRNNNYKVIHHVHIARIKVSYHNKFLSYIKVQHNEVFEYENIVEAITTNATIKWTVSSPKM